ncbi:MAG: hypothetical protein JW712_00950 [Dehalococcoidales bacterium]|nr:hypothetical protein [Dehalococcoidales bacterium]
MATVQLTLIELKHSSKNGFGGGKRTFLFTEDQVIPVDGSGGGKTAFLKEADTPEFDSHLPGVVTGPMTDSGVDVAVVSGFLADDGGLGCECAFQWGLTDLYENTTPFQEKSVGEYFTEVLTGLLPDTSYHFRTVSWNGYGVSYGIDKVFKTLADIDKSFFQRPLFFLLNEDE